MAANQAFQLEESMGWKMGLRNLLRKENGEWWKTRRWWIQLIVWMLIINASLLVILIAFPQAAKVSGQVMSESELFTIAMQVLFGVSSLGIGVGVIISSQDEIIGEKTTGTAAWVLSKPASRIAFYLSKLIANAASIMIVVIGLPFLVAFGILMFYFPGLDVVSYLLAVLVLIIHTFFYLTLSLMIGVFAEKRSLVLSITLAALLGGQLMMNFIKELALFTPFGLSQIMIGLSTQGVSALPLALWTPVGITVILSLIFVVLAFWKIQKLEF